MSLTLRERSCSKLPASSDISVIIPNLNSPVIEYTLTALEQQRFDLTRVEVIVVGLDEPGLVIPSPRIRFISTEGPQSAARNRNIGMDQARGDIFCFIDADCVPAPDWLAQLTASYVDSEVHVVGGGVVFEADNYWAMCDHLSWFHQFLATSPAGERAHLPTLNLSVRRSVVECVGPLDESYPSAAGEDTEWTARMRAAGFRLHFEPSAVVRHLATRSSIRQMWLHAYQYGRSSPKIRPAAASALTTTESLLLPRRWWALLLLMPLLSMLATVRVVARQWARRAGWKAIAGIGLSKVAWCLGAAEALRQADRRHW